MIYAYQFIARDRAGLVLAGRDEDGEWQWIGDFQQWQQVERLEEEILNGV